MKLIKRSLDSKAVEGAEIGCQGYCGSVTLQCESSEDVWHTYHLLCIGDAVRTTTLRKIKRESSTGSVTSDKVKLTLTLRVIAIQFDANDTTLRSGDTDVHAEDTHAQTNAQSGSSSSSDPVLHISGVVMEENKHVRLGAHHTFHLEINRNFTIIKDTNVWDSISLQRVTELITCV